MYWESEDPEERERDEEERRKRWKRIPCWMRDNDEDDYQVDWDTLDQIERRLIG